MASWHWQPEDTTAIDISGRTEIVHFQTKRKSYFLHDFSRREPTATPEELESESSFEDEEAVDEEY